MPKADKKTPKEAGDVLALDSRQNDQKMDEDGAEEQLPLHERKGVVYIGHIPHGFYEKQMKEYFKQFGAMKRMVLARSRKTGNSKGYAFCQFEDETVAKVVAETMNGYPIMEKVLVAALVPAEKVHSAMFRYADRKWKKIPWRKVIREKQLEPKTDEQAEKKMHKLLTRERKEAAKLAEAGVDYDFPTSYMGLATSVGLIEEEDSGDEAAAAPAKAVKEGSKGAPAASASMGGKGKGKEEGKGKEAPVQHKVAPVPSVGQKRKRSEDEAESKPAAPSKPAPVAAAPVPAPPSKAGAGAGKGAKEAKPAAKGGKAASAVKPQVEDSEEEEEDDEEYEFARDDEEDEDEEDAVPAPKKGKATATTAAAAAGKEKRRVSFGKNQVALLPPIAKVKEAIAAAQVRQQAQAQAGTGTQVKGVLKQPKAAPQAPAAGSAAAAKTSKAKTAATRPLLHNKK